MRGARHPGPSQPKERPWGYSLVGQIARSIRGLAWLAIPVLLLGISLAHAGETGQPVRFVSRDGVTLVGSYYPPPRGPVPAILLLHMLSRDRTDWNPLAGRLQAAGWAVLSFDLRGHGESRFQGGRPLYWRDFSDADFNKMVLDVEAAQGYLKGLKEVDANRVAILGASIGCNVALNFASDHPQVRALVLLSPGLKYRGVLSEPAMKRYGASGRSALIVARTDDGYSADSSKKLKSLAAARTTLILYERAGHGTQMLAKERGLEEQILSWLKTALR
ncbi:MAG: alpha/beta fold hydrolase [Candidatus Tectomicrobia bacterium]|uniref:Alpha/beta fold hydrolase n=1 Tax=Tectimicrobiota bacterium TaxID=2528274 RepID=A0A932FWM2_UNCTE|nr:alpha/beta fold hydrolase [Candidatus Tectomicrobia bacterium]